MYKIALCDDERIHLEMTEDVVRKYCVENQIKAVIESFDDSDRLAECIEERRGFDIYILDIEMPKITGMELASLIEQYSGNSYVIFLTSYDKYAVKACNMNVLNYVLKDQMEKEVPGVLHKLFERVGKINSDKVYTISNQRKYIRILQKDIIYIYKDQKNSAFVLTGFQTENERATLQDVYQRLDNPDMYMLDRGIILNLNHIRKIYENKVKMDDGHDITSSQVHINELKEHLIVFFGERI